MTKQQRDELFALIDDKPFDKWFVVAQGSWCETKAIQAMLLTANRYGKFGYQITTNRDDAHMVGDDYQLRVKKIALVEDFRMAMEEPKRHIELKFSIGADDYETLLNSMEQFVWFMQREHAQLDHDHHGVSGGPDCGYAYDFFVHPEQTHEAYHEQLKLYLAEKRAEKADKVVSYR